MNNYIFDLIQKNHLEKHLEDILQAVAEGITVQDPKGNLIYANAAAAAVLGFNSVEELLQTPIMKFMEKFELYDDLGRPFLLKDLPGRKALAGERPEPVTIKWYNKETKKYLWAEIKASPIFDKEGKVISAVNIFHDLTKTKAIQRIGDETPAMIVVYNINTGKYIYVNNAVMKILGYQPEDFINGGLPFVGSLVHPEDIALIMDKNNKALEKANNHITIPSNESIVNFEYRMKHKNGSWRWLHSDGSVYDRTADGKVDHVMNISIDITERKEAEENARKAAADANEHLKAIVDGSLDAIISKTLDGIILSWNTGAERIYGYTAAEAIGKNVSFFAPQDKYNEIPSILRRVAMGDLVDHFETQRIRKDGKVIHVSLTISPVKDSAGNIVGASTIARDITEQKEVAEKMEKANRRIKYIIESVSDGFISFDKDMNILFVNSKAAEMLGRNVEEIVNQNLFSIIPQVKDSPYFFKMMEVMEKKLPATFDAYSSVFKKWFSIRIYPTKEGLAIYFQDVTEGKRAQEEVEKAKERLELAQQAGKIGTFEWNLKTNELFWTPELEALYGLPPGGFAGKLESWQSTLHPEDFMRTNEEITRAGKLGQDLDTQFRIIWPNKSIRWIKSKAKVYYDDTGQPSKMIGINVDITDQKQFEEKIKYHFYHDNLTDLPNRIYFNEKMHEYLTKLEDSDKMLAVLIIDLDRFKNINDSLGHAIGDRLIQEVSLRLSNCLEEKDVLARLGGDEFTILLPDIEREEQAAKLSQKILESLRHPFFLDGNELYITPSIGISLFPFDGKDVSSLMKNADSALYRAKEQGRNNYQFYTPSMNATAFQQLTLENTLRRALDFNEFVLYYQPQIDVRTSKICKAEALIRWQHPEMGLTFPDEFIGLAEVTGLIEPIGEWVFRIACLQGKRWHDQGYKISIAVNVSARQFKQKRLTGIIRDILSETGFDPHFLEVELTESILTEDPESTLAILNDLKKMGLQLALDDFSTGYSSLNYVKHYPFDVLKIDKSFVRGIPRESGDCAIANSIITLGHSMGMQIVAEGVEKYEQSNHLRKNNCDKMQGFLFSGPVSAEAFQALLEKDEIGIKKMA